MMQKKHVLLPALVAVILLGAGCSKKSDAPVISKDGEVTVIDNSQHPRVLRPYDAMFVDELAISSEAEDSLFFYRVNSISVAPNGDIAMLDAGNSRVLVFDAQGKLLRQFGRKGSGPGEFKNAAGLGRDARGNLYALDAGNARVEKFSPSGKFLAARSVDFSAQALDCIAENRLLLTRSRTGGLGAYAYFFTMDTGEAQLVDSVFYDTKDTVPSIMTIYLFEKFVYDSRNARILFVPPFGYNVSIFSAAGKLTRRVVSHAEKIPPPEIKTEQKGDAIRTMILPSGISGPVLVGPDSRLFVNILHRTGEGKSTEFFRELDVYAPDGAYSFSISAQKRKLLAIDANGRFYFVERGEAEKVVRARLQG